MPLPTGRQADAERGKRGSVARDPVSDLPLFRDNGLAGTSPAGRKWGLKPDN